MFKVLDPGIKLFAIFGTAFLLNACSPGPSSNDDAADDGAPPSRAWNLVWSDEFSPLPAGANATACGLNADNWEIQLGDGSFYGISGWGNNEEQYYTDSCDNVNVRDGNLVITAIADNPIADPTYGNGSFTYSSGRIRSEGLVDFTYGRVEARIKMPPDLGVWNAFWLLGTEPGPYGGWPAKGEIDILETWVRGDVVTGNGAFISGAAHFGAPGVRRFISGERRDFNFYDDYHVYAIEWDAEQIRWFVDGENYFSLRSDNYWNYYFDEQEGYQAGGDNAPFDAPQHIILNAAVGGTLPTSAGEFPDPATLLGAEMLVDYVRVYECAFDPVTGVGCKNSIDQADEFKAFQNPAQAAFSTEFDIFIDGPGPEDLPVGREVVFETENNIAATEVQDPDDPSNRYMELIFGDNTGGLPRFSLVDAEGDRFILARPPSNLGNFVFDLYIESASTTPGGVLRVGFIGDGSQRNSATLRLDNYPSDEWVRVVVPLADMNQGGFLDYGNIQQFVQFVSLNSHLRIDNIRFACGAGVCGLVDNVPVFIDEVDPVWTRGIVGNDSIAISAGNADYSEPSGNHVEWEIVDTGDPAHNSVVQTTFGTSGAVGAVNFVGADSPVPSIAALSDGEFRFDIRMIRNPNDVGILFKVDGAFSTTGEQPLGDLPLNVWRTFRCPISNLSAQGLDVSTITAPFVMVPGNGGTGQDVIVQWDNVIFDPLSTGPGNSLSLPLSFGTGSGFCLPIAPFEGGAFKVTDNPNTSGISTDPQSGELRKFESYNGQTFGGISISLDTPIVFGPASDSTGKAFRIKLFNNRAPGSLAPDGVTPLGPMRLDFKLEGAAGTVDVARTITTTQVGAWEELLVDFNGAGAGSYEAITLIIDNGIMGDGSSRFTLYFDDIEQVDSSSDIADLSVPYTFDDPSKVYPNPTGFVGARGSITSGPVPVDPATDGNVGEVVYDFFDPAAGKGLLIVGAAGGFHQPIDFELGRTTLRVRVHTPSAGTQVLLKAEDADDPGRFAEITLATPNAGWSTLDFDFSSVSIEVNEEFEILGLVFEPTQCIFNPVFDPTCTELPEQKTYYFDDIELLP